MSTETAPKTPLSIKGGKSRAIVRVHDDRGWVGQNGGQGMVADRTGTRYILVVKMPACASLMMNQNKRMRVNIPTVMLSLPNTMGGRGIIQQT